MDALLKMTHISVYNCLNFHIVLMFTFLVILFGNGMSSTLLMSPFLAAICAIWIGVWKPIYGCQHWMQVSITWFFWFVFVIIIIKTVIAFIYYIHSLAPCKIFIVSFNVVCRTPIRHVSSSNGWIRTHAHVAGQQHHLSMKGLRDIRPRQWLQEMKGMRLMQWKQ